jgi:hypothetical protein
LFTLSIGIICLQIGDNIVERDFKQKNVQQDEETQEQENEEKQLLQNQGNREQQHN